MIESEQLVSAAEDAKRLLGGYWTHIKSGRVFRVIDVVWMKSRSPDKQLTMSVTYKERVNPDGHLELAGDVSGPIFCQSLPDFQSRFTRGG